MNVLQYDELQKIKDELASILARCRKIEEELEGNLSRSAISVAVENMELAREYISDALDENQ